MVQDSHSRQVRTHPMSRIIIVQSDQQEKHKAWLSDIDAIEKLDFLTSDSPVVCARPAKFER
jgi:hypothetical protein